jgi:pimeloyl-ACP methyl ester carboxylesterase
LTDVAAMNEAGRPSLRYARLGKGAPCVLLHGYPESLQIYSALAPLLAPSFDVLAFDWPGMGGSDAWTGGASPVQMAERLVRVMDHFELERATVGALDMGGQPALVAAAEHPDRIERLVVMNSLVMWDEETSWEIRLLRERGYNRILIERFPRLVFGRAERTFLPRGRRLTRELRAELWSHFRRPEVRRYVSRMCAGFQGLLPRLPSYYERVEAPTLLLWGGRDKHFPVRHAERLHDLLGRSELEVLADGWHWMVVDRAPEVAERIRQFALTTPEG